MMSGPGGRPGGGVAAMQGGGFRGGFGHFNEEHLEEQSFASSAKQHQLTQQTSNAAQSTTGGSALQQAGVSQESPQRLKDPREVGTIKEEAKRVFSDVIDELKGFFSLSDLLGIKPGDTPEQQQKKQAVLQRYNKLSDEQKQIAQKNYQEKMQRQKREEEEKQRKQQQEAQAKSANIAPPSSPKKGAAGPAGSKKQKAITQLQQDRKTLSNAKGAN